jgi:hypothetical protein
VAFASTGLSIQPVKIDETVNPGQTLTGQILLQNVSDGPVDVAVSVDDFVPNSGADSIQFVSRAEGVTTVRDWIQLPAKGFAMKAGEQKEIPYTIVAPTNAEPGGHYGVMLFNATPSGGTAGSLKVGTQVGMIVLISIPGNHLEKGNILDFTTVPFVQHGPVSFNMTFQNTGTVHFEPKGSIIITNMLGQKAAEVPITGQVVLPTSVKKLSFFWDSKGFQIGRYAAVATVKDGDGNSLTSKSVSFWILPVWYIVGFFIGLLLVYLILRYIRKHVRISVVK